MAIVIDLDEQHLDSYCSCLEEYDARMVEGGQHKKAWITQMTPRGLRCKLAVEEDGTPIGMVETIPIEESFALGEKLAFVNCIWVHGHKGGVGNRQKRGAGLALLAAAEQDARDRGMDGIAAWGLALPLWMKASWFKRHGYLPADRAGIMSLVWKPFHDRAQKPAWMRGKLVPETNPGQATVSIYLNGQCPLMNFKAAQVKRIAGEFGESVAIREISTSDKPAMLEHRTKDSLFIGKRELRPGPPVPDEKLRRMIRKAVKRAE